LAIARGPGISDLREGEDASKEKRGYLRPRRLHGDAEAVVVVQAHIPLRWGQVALASEAHDIRQGHTCLYVSVLRDEGCAGLWVGSLDATGRGNSPSPLVCVL